MIIDKKYFFDTVRHSLFGGVLNQSQVDGLNSIIDHKEASVLTRPQLAYVLATVHWETDRTFKPIEEYGKGKGRRYGMKIRYDGRPYEKPDKIYFGRGYVQLTWYENYEKFGRLLNLPLLEKPELLLQADVSASVLLIGMTRGLFTGRKLSDYINPSRADYVNARRIINVLDKADTIAGIARKFEEAIR